MTHRLGLAKAAILDGFDVHVACSVSSYRARIEATGCVLHHLSIHRGSLNPFSLLCTMLSFYWLVRKLRPDIIHNVALGPIIIGTPIALAASSAVLINAVNGLGIHFTGNSWLRGLLERILKYIARAPRVTITAQNQEDQAFLSSLSPKKIVLIRGSGVDAGHFHPPRHRSNSTEAVTITQASRLLWSKGINELVLATKILRNKGYNITTQLVGKPDLCNKDHVPTAIIEDWHREGVITWLGPQEDVAAVYRPSDIAVLVSYYRDGVPKSLIEAAATGLPIVTTNMPGCRDIVVDGVNGYLVPPKDAFSLATALERLITNQALRHTLGSQGRQRVLDIFEDHLIYHQTIALYRDTLANATQTVADTVR